MKHLALWAMVVLGAVGCGGGSVCSRQAALVKKNCATTLTDGGSGPQYDLTKCEEATKVCTANDLVVQAKVLDCADTVAACVKGSEPNFDLAVEACRNGARADAGSLTTTCDQAFSNAVIR